MGYLRNIWNNWGRSRSSEPSTLWKWHDDKVEIEVICYKTVYTIRLQHLKQYEYRLVHHHVHIMHVRSLVDLHINSDFMPRFKIVHWNPFSFSSPGHPPNSRVFRPLERLWQRHGVLVLLEQMEACLSGKPKMTQWNKRERTEISSRCPRRFLGIFQPPKEGMFRRRWTRSNEHLPDRCIAREVMLLRNMRLQ